MALTPKQDAFVREYLIDLNAAAAARRAGYSGRTADRTGHENLKKPEVAAAIAAAQAERSRRTEVTADLVVAELARVAFSRMADFATWGPDGVTLRPSAALPPDAAACVAEVTETTTQGGGSLRFKLHSKTQALELLGRHLGMWKDRVDVSGSVLIQTLAGVDEGQILGATRPPE